MKAAFTTVANDFAMSIRSTNGANAKDVSRNGGSETGGGTNDGSEVGTVRDTITLRECITVIRIARDRKGNSHAQFACEDFLRLGYSAAQRSCPERSELPELSTVLWRSVLPRTCL